MNIAWGTSRRAAAAVGLSLALAAVLLATEIAAQTAPTGIRNTRHNLGAGGPAGNNSISGTEEVCVFCHTPHGANTGVGVALWNKATPPSTAYTLYSSTTMDASRAIDGIGGGAIGSVSIACLSCHDGTQAMNSVINAPGSGGFNPTGAPIGGSWLAGTGPTPVDPATGRLGGGIGNLGTNLTNDHPIGMQYCGGGWSDAAATGTCRDPDFNNPATDVIGGQRVFWVETAGNTTRNKTDLILYSRAFPGGAGPSVECGSCHDPHVENNAANDHPTFLRVANRQSALCLSCHVK